MLDGQVDSKPMEISSSSTDSPNTSWGLDQMKKNGYLPCVINYDPLNEEPDYANPKISEDVVEYFGKPLAEDKRKQRFNQEQDKRREAEYPTISDKVEALFEYVANDDKTGIEALKLWINAVNEKYPLEK